MANYLGLLVTDPVALARKLHGTTCWGGCSDGEPCPGDPCPAFRQGHVHHHHFNLPREEWRWPRTVVNVQPATRSSDRKPAENERGNVFAHGYQTGETTFVPEGKTLYFYTQEGKLLRAATIPFILAGGEVECQKILAGQPVHNYQLRPQTPQEIKEQDGVIRGFPGVPHVAGFNLDSKIDLFCSSARECDEHRAAVGRNFHLATCTGLLAGIPQAEIHLFICREDSKVTSSEKQPKETETEKQYHALLVEKAEQLWALGSRDPVAGWFSFHVLPTETQNTLLGKRPKLLEFTQQLKLSDFPEEEEIGNIFSQFRALEEEVRERLLTNEPEFARLMTWAKYEADRLKSAEWFKSTASEIEKELGELKPIGADEPSEAGSSLSPPLSQSDGVTGASGEGSDASGEDGSDGDAGSDLLGPTAGADDDSDGFISGGAEEADAAAETDTGGGLEDLRDVCGLTVLLFQQASTNLSSRSPKRFTSLVNQIELGAERALQAVADVLPNLEEEKTPKIKHLPDILKKSKETLLSWQSAIGL